MNGKAWLIELSDVSLAAVAAAHSASASAPRSPLLFNELLCCVIPQSGQPVSKPKHGAVLDTRLASDNNGEGHLGFVRPSPLRIVLLSCPFFSGTVWPSDFSC